MWGVAIFCVPGFRSLEGSLTVVKQFPLAAPSCLDRNTMWPAPPLLLMRSKRRRPGAPYTPET